MGSDSDLPIIRKATDMLASLEIPFEVHVYSAHRTPDEARDFSRNARANGFGVIIAAAGMAAHLAGAVAANTTLPVIGIPCESANLGGMDALLSTVQMPTGIPVATVAINGASNAALLAAQFVAVEGKYSAAGSIYIQRNNSNQFTDRNTVIYGHNMKNKTMFRTLHNFRDPKFFEQNEFFTIYTPGHIKTYRIFSAYRYDNRHILNSFDFADKAVYEEYLKFATNPVSLIKNVREGVKVTADDPIVTLSTCISDKRYRYLVQGVLIKDELTK